MKLHHFVRLCQGWIFHIEFNGDNNCEIKPKKGEEEKEKFKPIAVANHLTNTSFTHTK